MLELHDNISAVVSPKGYQWKDVCFKWDFRIFDPSIQFNQYWSPLSISYNRIPIVTEQPNAAGTNRRKRQINQTETLDDDDSFFNFDFDGFDSNFGDALEPNLDPDFEPAIDLPTGNFSLFIRSSKSLILICIFDYLQKSSVILLKALKKHV